MMTPRIPAVAPTPSFSLLPFLPRLSKERKQKKKQQQSPVFRPLPFIITFSFSLSPTNRSVSPHLSTPPSLFLSRRHPPLSFALSFHLIPPPSPSLSLFFLPLFFPQTPPHTCPQRCHSKHQVWQRICLGQTRIHIPVINISFPAAPARIFYATSRHSHTILSSFWSLYSSTQVLQLISGSILSHIYSTAPFCFISQLSHLRAPILSFLCSLLSLSHPLSRLLSAPLSLFFFYPVQKTDQGQRIVRL